MRELLGNRWLSIAVRFFLGAVFMYSAWPKIIDPPGFAHVIWNYQILPSASINLLAMTLPWLELIAGLALITGLLHRGGALAAAVMLMGFIAALAFNLYRDLPVDCGCFSLAAAGKSHDELISAMKTDILRDLGLLLLALQALYTRVIWARPAPLIR